MCLKKVYGNLTKTRYLEKNREGNVVRARGTTNSRKQSHAERSIQFRNGERKEKKKKKGEKHVFALSRIPGILRLSPLLCLVCGSYIFTLRNLIFAVCLVIYRCLPAIGQKPVCKFRSESHRRVIQMQVMMTAGARSKGETVGGDQGGGACKRRAR